MVKQKNDKVEIKTVDTDRRTPKMGTLRNLYKSFIDTSFELVFRTTPDGKILFTNRTFLKSLGFENSRKVKGLNITDLLETPAHFIQLQESLLVNKFVASEIVIFKKRNGTTLTGRVNGRLYFDENSITVFNWAVQDISLQVESETILKTKNDELAKVNHQMEKFLYSTSHDLRSPLTTILGLLNLTRMEMTIKDSNILDYLSKIEISTNKMDKIIRDIMSFSRTTYQRIGSERIDFEKLVWKSFNQWRDDPALRKINFEVTTTGIYPFYSDPERLEIILNNIIRNSIHFYDAQKARPLIRINITLSKVNAQLEFIDNGVGIGKQHLDLIFNMFYKASVLSKGAGLGLYIVKETLEKLNATLTVESEIGFGTVFRVTIPNDHKGTLINRKLQLSNQAVNGDVAPSINK